MSDTELRNESPEGLDPASPHLYEQLSSEIGGVLESMDELSDYLERVVHAVRRYVDGCDEVGITLLSANRPHTAAYTTVNTLEVDSIQYALDEGPCLDSARTGTENRASMSEAHERWPAFAAAAKSPAVKVLSFAGSRCLRIAALTWSTVSAR